MGAFRGCENVWHESVASRGCRPGFLIKLATVESPTAHIYGHRDTYRSLNITEFSFIPPQNNQKSLMLTCCLKAQKHPRRLIDRG